MTANSSAAPVGPLLAITEDPSGGSLGLALPEGELVLDTVRGTAAEPRTWRDPQVDPDESAAVLAEALIDFGELGSPRLGLVPVARGADVLSAIGWTGPVNYRGGIGPFSAVLRCEEG
ncbi:hypothetical protein ACO0M4_38895 [Streptomyces sp. RGM 3693]|uniref:hypothetical protein n=1 Tax=Streptomyces sp. RGM 3693 TaxID=3413284 RepID=UPI003D299DAD